MFSFFAPSHSAELVKLLEEDRPLEEVIEEPTCENGYKSSYDKLLAYLRKNLQKLLDRCFSDDHISQKCFTLLNSTSDYLIKEIKEMDLISPIGMKILVSENKIFIERLASITHRIIKAFPGDDIYPVCNYFNRLLMFVSDPIVFQSFRDTFELGLSDAFISGLKDNGFLMSLRQLLEGSNLELNISILNLIPFIAKTPFADELRDPELIQCLLADHGGSDAMLFSQWNAVYSIVYNQETKSPYDVVGSLESYFPVLYGYLKGDKLGPVIKPHQIIALKVLGLMCSIDRVRTSLTQNGIGDTILSLITKYHNNTFSNLAIIDFICNNTDYEALIFDILDKVKHKLEEFILDGVSHAKRGFVLRLFSSLLDEEVQEDGSDVYVEETNEKNRKYLDKLSAPAKEKYEELHKIAASSYGGEIQQNRPTLDLTAEQLLNLLKALGGGPHP